MTDLDLAKYAAKQVFLNAGDAEGNAKTAHFLLENGPDITRAIEAIGLAKDQAERTARLADRALDLLRELTPNA